MGTQRPTTRALLRNWHEGNEAALHCLLERNLNWLRARVSKRLGRRLRRKAETTDFVQDAAVELLRYGPRFLVANQGQFRALLGRIVENVLRDENDRFRARCRNIDRERPLPPDSVLDLTGRGRQEEPSQVAQRHESEAWLRLGIRLLNCEERQVISLREWEKLSFGHIAKEIGTTEDAARMRFNRALKKLAGIVMKLQRGELNAAVSESEVAASD